MMNRYFISGGNRGIGLQVVKLLAENPRNQIFTTCRDKGKSVELLKIVEEYGNIEVFTLDMLNEESIEKFTIEIAEKAKDGIDIFISNAGIGQSCHRVMDTPRDTWLDHYKTNALGPIYLFKALYPLLLKRSTRKVVFISSAEASIGSFIPIYNSAYGQSKAGLNFTIKQLSVELDDEDFTIVALNPGLVNNDHVKRTMDHLGPELSKELAFALISPEQAAKNLIDFTENISRSQNSKFLNFDGTEIAW